MTGHNNFLTLYCLNIHTFLFVRQCGPKTNIYNFYSAPQPLSADASQGKRSAQFENRWYILFKKVLVRLKNCIDYTNE